MSTVIAHIHNTFRSQDDGRLLSKAAALASIGAWSCDLDGDRLEWTDGVFDLFGLEREWHPDRRDTVELYCEPYRDALEEVRSDAIRTCSGFTMDAQIRRTDGDLRWMRIIAKTEARNGRAVRLYGMKQDITADKVELERLRQLAENDPLTGLANRARFHSGFLDLANGSDALADAGALVLFDLNDLKSVNDRWGHAAGDRHIVQFAERLAAAFPQASLIARIGGDEFAMLLPARLSPPVTECLVRSRINALCADVHTPGQSVSLAFSAGMAFNCSMNTSPDALFAAADAALYAAKRTGRTALCLAPMSPIANF